MNRKRKSVTTTDAMLSSINVNDVQQTKHIAELLEISGANEVSEAVKIQLAAMKTRDDAHVVGLFKKLKEDWDEGSNLPNTREVGSMAAVLAASKFKKALKVRSNEIRSFLPPSHVSEVLKLKAGTEIALTIPLLMTPPSQKKQEEKLAALEAFSQMLCGVKDGAMYGPFRWIFTPRAMLPEAWEWVAFHANPWKHAIMHHIARQVKGQFPDEEVRFAPICAPDPL